MIASFWSRELRCTAAVLKPTKAFSVASDHTTWWPYLLGGVICSVTIGWPLPRRFVAKNT
jgi:hypothetical protein